MLKVGSDSLFMDKGCIFQKLDRIYNKYVVFKYNENFSANHSQAWVNSAVYSGYHGLHGDCAGICVTRYDKWFDTAANVLQDDG